MKSEANDFREFDVRFIGEALRSDQQAGNFGRGLFNAVADNSKSGSKNLLPEQKLPQSTCANFSQPK